MDIRSTYETLFIVDMTGGDEMVKSTVEKFTSLISEHGEILTVNEWGKRKLAYPINDRTEGYYVLVNFSSPHDFPLELERLFGINGAILRSMVVAADAPKEGEVKAAPEIVVLSDPDNDPAPRRPRGRRPYGQTEEAPAAAPAAEPAAEPVAAEAAEAAPEAPAEAPEAPAETPAAE